jgi:hypothetical protein
MKEIVNPHPPGCPWHSVAENYGIPVVKYCEETLCGWISEPANTWSNIGYVIAFLVLYKWSRGRDYRLRWFPWAMLIMGLGSFFYHMSNTYITQIVDYIGMYVMVYWMIVCNLTRAGVSFKKSLGVYILLMILSQVVMHVMFINRMNYQVIIVGSGALVLISEIWANKKWPGKVSFKWLGLGLVFVGIAQGFSLLDARRIWCDPTNHWIQGHALWHWISALGLTVAYKHWEQFFPEKS